MNCQWPNFFICALIFMSRSRLHILAVFINCNFAKRHTHRYSKKMLKKIVSTLEQLEIISKATRRICEIWTVKDLPDIGPKYDRRSPLYKQDIVRITYPFLEPLKTMMKTQKKWFGSGTGHHLYPSSSSNVFQHWSRLPF